MDLTKLAHKCIRSPRGVFKLGELSDCLHNTAGIACKGLDWALSEHSQYKVDNNIIRDCGFDVYHIPYFDISGAEIITEDEFAEELAKCIYSQAKHAAKSREVFTLSYKNTPERFAIFQQFIREIRGEV